VKSARFDTFRTFTDSTRMDTSPKNILLSNNIMVRARQNNDAQRSKLDMVVSLELNQPQYLVPSARSVATPHRMR